MKKKKQSLVQKAPRLLSPAEQIPADVLQEIFSYLDLRELTGIATVSKFWNEQIHQDSRWHEFYIKEFNELYRLFNNKIPLNIIRKKYLETKRIIGEVEEAIVAEKPKQKAERTVKIFKKAVRKNSLETVHVLLKVNFLNIHGTVKFMHSLKGVCLRSPLVHYVALNGSLDMVKLLLLHGANVTTTIRWHHTNSNYESDILDDLSFGSTSMKSLVWIGYAEHFLFKNVFGMAIKSFEKSCQYDPKIISDYIQQVYEDKMGFKFNYDESLIKKLNSCFEPILNKANEKRCIIS